MVDRHVHRVRGCRCCDCGDVMSAAAPGPTGQFTLQSALPTSEFAWLLKSEKTTNYQAYRLAQRHGGSDYSEGSRPITLKDFELAALIDEVRIAATEAGRVAALPEPHTATSFQPKQKELPPRLWWIDYGLYGAFTINSDVITNAKRENAKVYEYHAPASPAPVSQTVADAVMAEREACALACEAVADHAEEARTNDAIASLAKTASTKSKLAEYKHLLTVQTFNAGIARCAEAIRARQAAEPAPPSQSQAAPSPQAEPQQLSMSMFASRADFEAAKAKQAGIVGWFDAYLNCIRWRKGLKNSDIPDGAPFYIKSAQDADSREPCPARFVLGEKLFSFTSHADWGNHASQAWKRAGVPPSKTLCIDQKGRACAWGEHFRIADDENTFPIDVYCLREDIKAPISTILAKGSTS